MQHALIPNVEKNREAASSRPSEKDIKHGLPGCSKCYAKIKVQAAQIKVKVKVLSSS